MSPQSHALAVDVDRSDQLLALSRTSLVSSDSRSISSRLRSSTNLDEIDGVGVLSRNAAEYRLQVGIGNVSIDVHMAAAAPSDDDRIPVGAEDPSKGGDNAYVTVVVFTDFRCPYCNRLSPTIDRIRESYAQDVLRIVFKHMPSPNLAYAKLASTVGQGVYALKGAELAGLKWPSWRDKRSLTLILDMVSYSAN